MTVLLELIRLMIGKNTGLNNPNIPHLEVDEIYEIDQQL